MASVRVRVVDADGAAVPGAHLSVPAASVPFPEFAYSAGADGAITLELAPGEYRLHADGPDGGAGEIAVNIGEAVEEVEIRLARA